MNKFRQKMNTSQRVIAVCGVLLGDDLGAVARHYRVRRGTIAHHVRELAPIISDFLEQLMVKEPNSSAPAVVTALTEAA